MKKLSAKQYKIFPVIDFSSIVAIVSMKISFVLNILLNIAIYTAVFAPVVTITFGRNLKYITMLLKRLRILLQQNESMLSRLASFR